MIDSKKLGDLIATIAPEVTYIQVGQEQNAFGPLWFLRLVKINRSRVYEVRQSFTEPQMNEVQDIRVLADVLVQELAEKVKGNITK